MRQHVKAARDPTKEHTDKDTIMTQQVNAVFDPVMRQKGCDAMMTRVHDGIQHGRAVWQGKADLVSLHPGHGLHRLAGYVTQERHGSKHDCHIHLP